MDIVVYSAAVLCCVAREPAVRQHRTTGFVIHTATLTICSIAAENTVHQRRAAKVYVHTTTRSGGGVLDEDAVHHCWVAGPNVYSGAIGGCVPREPAIPQRRVAATVVHTAAPEVRWKSAIRIPTADCEPIEDGCRVGTNGCYDVIGVLAVVLLDDAEPVDTAPTNGIALGEPLSAGKRNVITVEIPGEDGDEGVRIARVERPVATAGGEPAEYSDAILELECCRSIAIRTGRLVYALANPNLITAPGYADGVRKVAERVFLRARPWSGAVVIVNVPRSLPLCGGCGKRNGHTYDYDSNWARHFGTLLMADLYYLAEIQCSC